MSKKLGTVPRSNLVDAPLPEATETYTVISHGFVIDTVKEKLEDRGFTVVNELYTCNEHALVGTGRYHINYGDDEDLGMMFTFSNSYDKTMRFRCAIGAYVKVNDMSVIGATSTGWARKHTGTADDETVETIEQQIANAEGYFQQLQADKEAMKNIKLTKTQYAELVGTLFLDNRLLSAGQLSIIKKQFEKPSNTFNSDPDSLWTLYNYILIALSECHPRAWMERQKLVHIHLMTNFDLTVFDDEVEEQTETMAFPVVDSDDAALVIEWLKANTEVYSPVYELTGADVLENIDKGMSPEVIDQIRAVLSQNPSGAIDNFGEEVSGKELLLKFDQYSFMKPAAVEETVEVHNEKGQVGTIQEPVEEVKPAGPKVIINRIPAEPKDLDAEEDADAEAVLKEIVHEKVGEILQEGLVKSGTDGKTQLPLTKERLAELNEEISNGAILPAAEDEETEVLNNEAVEPAEEPEEKPSIKMAEAIQIYGHLITEEQKEALLKGERDEEAIGVLKSAYLADLEKKKAEELIEKLKEPVTSENIAEKVETIKEVETLMETKVQLPSVPSEAKIETPKEEEVVEDVVSEVESEDEFFISKTDLDEMYPGVVLELGNVVTIGEEDCEITTMAKDDADDQDMYGLTALSIEAEPETVLQPGKPAPDTMQEIEEEPVQIGMDFEIGEPEVAVAPETMLRTTPEKKEEEPVVDEQQAEIDAALEVMNNKVELTPAEIETRNAISNEIYELYGERYDFTYKLSAGQYAVTLETDEVVVLTESYINSLKEADEA